MMATFPLLNPYVKMGAGITSDDLQGLPAKAGHHGSLQDARSQGLSHLPWSRVSASSIGLRVQGAE